MNSHYQYVSPLKYLHPYHAKDHESFFGRKKEVKDVFRLFKETNLVVIYGPSGSGKTSLVQCGLTNQFFDWKPITIRRSENLIDSFFRKLKKIFDGDLCDELKSSFEELHAFKIKIENDGYVEDSNDILKKKKANLTLIADKIYDRVLYTPFFIFDQFEELFIFGDFNEIEKFSYLLSLLSRNFSRGNIVICIQTEFFANLLSLERHNRHIIDYKYLVDDPNISQVKVIIDKTFANFNINQYISPITEDLIKIEKEVKEKRRDEIIRLLLKIANEMDYSGTEKIHLPFLQIYLNKLYIEDFYRTYPSKSIEYEKQLQTNNKEIGKIKKAIKNGSSEFKELKEAKKKLNHKILDVYKIAPDQVELPFQYLPLEFEENEIELFGDISKIIKNYLSEVNQIVIERDNEIKKGKHNDVVVKFLKHFITEQDTSKVVEIEYRERISDNIEQIDEYLVIKDQKLKESIEFDLFPNIDEIKDVDESVGDIIEELLDARILKKRGNFIELSQSLLIPIIKKIPVKKMIKEYYRMHFNSAFILYTKEKDKKPLSLDRIKEYKKYLKDITQNDPNGKKMAFWKMSVKHHDDIRLEEERKEKEREKDERRKKIKRYISYFFLAFVFIIFVLSQWVMDVYEEKKELIKNKERIEFSTKIVNTIEIGEIDITNSYRDLKQLKTLIELDEKFEWADFPYGVKHLKKLETNFIAHPFYLKKLELPNSIEDTLITNHHILSTKSRQYDSFLFIFARTKHFLSVAKVKYPFSEKDSTEWKIIGEGNSISSFVPNQQEDGSLKIIYADNLGIHEVNDPFINSEFTTTPVSSDSRVQSLKVLHQLKSNHFIGLDKESKNIYDIKIQPNKLSAEINIISNFKKNILRILKGSYVPIGQQVDDSFLIDQNNQLESKIYIEKISNLRKLSENEITFIVYLNYLDEKHVFFIKQELGDSQNKEDGFKHWKLKDVIDDAEIEYNSLNDIRISDNYITIVTSHAIYQKELGTTGNLLSDNKSIVIPIDDVNSIDLENDKLMVGSDDATAKLFTSYMDGSNNKYHISSTFKGHKDAILNVSFINFDIDSVIKDYVLTSGEDGSINIWDASPIYDVVDSTKIQRNANLSSSQNIKDLNEFPFIDQRHKDVVRDFAISNDSLYLVSSSNDNTAIVWKKGSQSEEKKYDLFFTIIHHSNVNLVSLKKSGEDYIVATASGKTVKLHKIDSDGEVYDMLSLIRNDHNIEYIEFGSDSDEKVIYTQDEMKFVRKWNWENFENDLSERTYGPKD